jgi:hypothetical protein
MQAVRQTQPSQATQDERMRIIRQNLPSADVS